ncbi:DUF72 domain-containing protein [Deinococcus hopiensis]|uniref:Uncharacterized conserved protein YecE, DUF72 family n=1 Tax=Deinococcus hopiensis KR-140 TaxID=695939 RepID=A0A1W1UAJ1_9DEIO|nr:DUF72 domain-containing protein [Deinococcus hopiensis]SMB78089.1 Uncharacterized conserved protein YecE, DUF72 family [Deinococcus hopiensis KR-140]
MNPSDISPAGRVIVGTSGWTYRHWRGVFYPDGLVQRRELEYLAGQFETVELNGSFYSLQTPETYARWAAQVPPGFLFAVKGGRFVTHMKKLRNVRAPLANFFASGLLRLEEHLGPILWQLPERLRFDPELLEEFLALLPSSTGAAAQLAEEHDAHLDGRAWTEVERDVPLRYALEVRHASFLTPDLAPLLRRYGVALVVADAAGVFPLVEEITAEFIYVRLHGSRELYRSKYEPSELERWAQRIQAWLRGRQLEDAVRLTTELVPERPRDVYVYFDNDIGAHAPFDALFLNTLIRAMPQGSPHQHE